MVKSKKVTRSRVSKRTVKPIKRSPSKRVSRRVQSISTKVKNYEDAYKACIEKALSTCSKRIKMVEKQNVKKAVSKKVSRKVPVKKTRQVSKKRITHYMDQAEPELTYRQFVSKHMHDTGIVDKPVTERVVIIAKMWNKHKQGK
jgi:hypothetical protein